MANQSSTGLRNAMAAAQVAALHGAHFELNAGASPTAGGFLKFYTGEPPASADDAVTGTLLLIVSLNGDGTPLRVALSPAGGLIKKPVGDVWRGTVLASGRAGYCRYVTDADTGGPSLTAPRMQGRVGEVDAEVIISDTDLVAGAPQDVKDFTFIVPTF